MQWLIKGLTKINPTKAGLMGKNLSWGTRAWNQLKAIPANALVDTQQWLYQPWMRALMTVTTKHGRLHNWAKRQWLGVERNIKDVQRLNNYSTGYGYRTNADLKYAGKYITDNKGNIRYARTIENVLDKDGNPILKEVLGKNGKPILGKDGKPIMQPVTKFVSDNNKLHPNWDLGRQGLRMLPGSAAIGGLMSASDKMSSSSNPYMAGLGKALPYTDMYMHTLPALASGAIRYPLEFASPWIKEYYRAKYYNAPPNLLAQLYKTFNPTGYAEYLNKTVNKKLNDYFTNDRSNISVVRDLFTGKFGDSSTPKSFFGAEG